MAQKHLFSYPQNSILLPYVIFSATWYTSRHLNSYACFNLFSTSQMQFLPNLFQPQSTVQWTGCFRQKQLFDDNLPHEIHNLIIKLPLILSWDSPVSTVIRLQYEWLLFYSWIHIEVGCSVYLASCLVTTGKFHWKDKKLTTYTGCTTV